ncbi:hypothetical protein [Planomonospora algeriensis]
MRISDASSAVDRALPAVPERRSGLLVADLDGVMIDVERHDAECPV